MIQNLDIEVTKSKLSTFARFKDLIIDKERKDDLELPEYDRVKMVGKGSFGVAVLYKRLHDNKLVVLKQINLTDLTPSERCLAMNEVEIFSKLHHPNIINYYGNFIKENTLFIEMEYADGGTLNTVLMKRGYNKYFPEKYILKVFEQITSAINYMHLENILHRDLKTANIFLNSKGIVKIGDFGISKIMNTKIHAETVLGTPYYFSPEMCEGKSYNQKSDIWALGCILGEFCCLKKAFAATNLSELVGKIMSGQYVPIPDLYSDSLKYVLKQMLMINADDRPSATELLQYWIPLVYKNMETIIGIQNFPNSELDSSSDSYNASTKLKITSVNLSLDDNVNAISCVRSVLYQLKSFGSCTSVDPLQLPPTLKICKVVTNEKHFIVISSEGIVYTWGEGNKGQLGHNLIETWRHIPTKIDSIKKHHIIDACAGDSFTILLTTYGEIFSFGDNSNGCLGHGKMSMDTILVPKKIEKFKNIKIIQISGGNHHIMALTDEQMIYTWGKNANGAINVQKLLEGVPRRIITENIFQHDEEIKKIYCGTDCSVIIMKNGSAYCSGPNNYNKLGFGSWVKVISKLSKMKITGRKIKDISISTNHSVILLEGGYVLTLGSNSEGQRGIGDNSNDNILKSTLVGAIKSKHILHVKAQPTYTIVSSDENVITFWGTRFGIPVINDSELKINFENTIKHSNISGIGNNTAAFTNFLASVYKSELVLDPVDILALYSSPEQLRKGNYIKLVDIYPLHHSVLFLVETTTPLTNLRQKQPKDK